jgi:CBS domain-containing protein
MTQNVITMDCNENVLGAIHKYRDHRVGSIVIKENERCVGIITERDLIERTININPEKTKIKEIMSSDIKTIHPFDPIEKAVEIMEKFKIKKLPVVSDKEELVGIVTITDIAYSVPELTGRVERFIQSWYCPSWTEKK